MFIFSFQLSNEMMQYSAACEQTQELLEKKLRLRSTLLGIFRREFPGICELLIAISLSRYLLNQSIVLLLLYYN